MNNVLTLGSLFDGSGGFPLGGLLAGIEPVWASEIEPFAVRVTTKRLPQMKHYGDVSELDGGKLEPVDIITFGSPCQNLSLAGNRSGFLEEYRRRQALVGRRVCVAPRRGEPRQAVVLGIDDECKLVVRFDGESRPTALNSGEASVRLL